MTSHQTQTSKSETGSSLFDAATIASELPWLGLKVLLFGMPGSGKTSFACDFEKPLLLIRPEEVEDGSISVRNVPRVYVTPPLTDPDQLIEIAQAQRETQRYKSIVLDGVDRFMDQVIRKKMGWANMPVQLKWGQVPQADWNSIGIIAKDCLKELMKLSEDGTNVIILGGERDYGDDRDSDVIVPKVMVALTPGLTGWLHGVMDYNLHTFKMKGYKERIKKDSKGNPVLDPNKRPIRERIETDQIQYCVHLTGHNLYATKFKTDRDRDVPPFINVTKLPYGEAYSKIVALIKGEENK